MPYTEVPPVNPYCSAMRVTLGALTLTLKPTFAALAQIEAELQTNIVPLAQRIAQADIGVRDLMAIFWHGAQAAGHQELTREALGQALLEKGMEDALKRAAEFLFIAVNGSQTMVQNKG